MSDKLTERYHALGDKFVALSMREKMLVLFAGIILIGLIGFFWLIEPVQLQTKALIAVQNQKNTELLKLSQQFEQLQIQVKQNPNDLLRDRLTQLKEQGLMLDARFEELTSDLVPAKDMPRLLESILSKSNKLQLLEMISIPPKTMLPEDKSQPGGQSAQKNVYQHGVRLVLKGQYFDIQEYLQQVENLEWRFYWKKLEFQVDEYPLSEVAFEVYTLSTSKAFIGV